MLDFCGNLEYFGQDLPGAETKLVKSLSQRLFEARLGLILALGENEPAVRQATATTLHEIVGGMNLDNFVVRPHRAAVERFRIPEAWTSLSPSDSEAVVSLSGLPSSIHDDDEDAKRFDLLVLHRQLAQLDGDALLAERLREAVQAVAASLLGRTAIPSVAAQAGAA